MSPPADPAAAAAAMITIPTPMQEEGEVPRVASSSITPAAAACQVTQQVLSGVVDAMCEKVDEEAEETEGGEAAEATSAVAGSVAAPVAAATATTVLTTTSWRNAMDREGREDAVAAAADGVPVAAPAAAVAVPVALAVPCPSRSVSDLAEEEEQQQQQEEGRQEQQQKQVPVPPTPSAAAAAAPVATAVTEEKEDQAVDMVLAEVEAEPSSTTAPVVEEQQQLLLQEEEAIHVATPTTTTTDATEQTIPPPSAPPSFSSSSITTPTSDTIITPAALLALQAQLQAAHTQTATAQAHCLQLGELGRRQVATLRAMVLGEVKEEAQTVLAQCQADVGQLGKTLLGVVEKERARAADLALALGKEAMRRRQLFNTLQEMRGNIRVLCRVRPPSSSSSSPSSSSSSLLPSLSLKEGGMGVAVVSSTEVSTSNPPLSVYFVLASFCPLSFIFKSLIRPFLLPSLPPSLPSGERPHGPHGFLRCC
jgi:hypothetical protein